MITLPHIRRSFATVLAATLGLGMASLTAGPAFARVGGASAVQYNQANIINQHLTNQTPTVYITGGNFTAGAQVKISIQPPNLSHPPVTATVTTLKQMTCLITTHACLSAGSFGAYVQVPASDLTNRGPAAGCSCNTLSDTVRVTLTSPSDTTVTTQVTLIAYVTPTIAASSTSPGTNPITVTGSGFTPGIAVRLNFALGGYIRPGVWSPQTTRYATASPNGTFTWTGTVPPPGDCGFQSVTATQLSTVQLTTARVSVPWAQGTGFVCAQ